MAREGLEKRKIITWAPYTMENLSREKGEAERVMSEVLGIESDNPEYNSILKTIGTKIITGTLVPLSDEGWKQLENTDSWRDVPEGDIKKAEELSKFYKKNFSGIMADIESGADIPAPIIFKSGSKMHLMSGNNRLMIARGLRQRPQVIIVEYS